MPTWWTNKLVVSSAYINSARVYLVYGSDMGDSDSCSCGPDCNCDDSMEESTVSEELIEDIMDELQEVTEVLDDDMLPPSYRYMANAS